MTPSTHSRRRFIRSAASAVAAPMILPSGVLGASRTAPGDRITLGIIGLGEMGTGHLKAFLQNEAVQVVALCDVHNKHYRDRKPGERDPLGLDPARQLVEDHYASALGKGSYAGCDAYTDFRKLCARDDIDAIIVATPDHWHALCVLEALRNGKDVYCEKPVTHLFAEGQAIYREVEKQGAVFQTGSQQRSSIRFRVAVEIVLNGLIGKVHSVEVGLPTGFSQPRTEGFEPAPPPPGLDYELWCGPSEKLPYIFARHHRNWRCHSACGGGQIMDFIGHHNDIAHWGLGVDASGPEEVEAIGWTFPETTIYNMPVDYEIRSRYAGGVHVSISNRHPMGTKWIGEDGWVYVDRGKIEASHQEWIQESFDRGPIKPYLSLNHHTNFLECIRSRKPCIAPAETGHRSVTPGHLGFISQAVGRPLKWDANTETVIGDSEAGALLKTVHYRDPWKFE